jgi:hypothetical protein
VGWPRPACRHLAFLSAVGANPTAKTTGSGAAGMARYARVKGEAEEAVKRDGPPVVSVFRPAMIIGSQHTPWLLEKVLPVFSFATPKKYRSITVDTIARAMVGDLAAAAAGPRHPSAVYHYPEMKTRTRSTGAASRRGSAPSVVRPAVAGSPSVSRRHRLGLGDLAEALTGFGLGVDFAGGFAGFRVGFGVAGLRAAAFEAGVPLAAGLAGLDALRAATSAA